MPRRFQVFRGRTNDQGPEPWELADTPRGPLHALHLQFDARGRCPEEGRHPVKWKTNRLKESLSHVSKKDLPAAIWSKYAKTSEFSVLAFKSKKAMKGKAKAAPKAKSKAKAKSTAMKSNK
eukprot:g8055.t1